VNGEIVRRSWGLIEGYKCGEGKGKGKEKEDEVMEDLLKVDSLCSSMILNQISSRASIAQGNALLSLYSRALAPSRPNTWEEGLVEVVERIRREVRSGRGGWKGNQSTAFGIVMSATGLSLGTLFRVLTCLAVGLISELFIVRTYRSYTSSLPLLTCKINPFFSSSIEPDRTLPSPSPPLMGHPITSRRSNRASRSILSTWNERGGGSSGGGLVGE